MALGYLDDSKLYAIASAIRAKTGGSATMSVDDMPDEIGSISTGAQVEPLSVTANGTYSAPTGYAYSPVTVNVSGGGGLTIDQVAEKTISGTVAGSASYIASYAFAYCSKLTAVSFPSASYLGFSAFVGCSNLSTAFFAEAKTVNNYAFGNCSKLTTVSIPNVSGVLSNAFYNCKSLSVLSLPSAKTIYSSAFNNCVLLVELHLDGVSSVPVLSGQRQFSSTPIGGYSTVAGKYGSVYVPASLYNSFLTAANWSSISARIVSV